MKGGVLLRLRAGRFVPGLLLLIGLGFIARGVLQSQRGEASVDRLDDRALSRRRVLEPIARRPGGITENDLITRVVQGSSLAVASGDQGS